MLELNRERFPYHARRGTVQITRVDLFLQLREGREPPTELGVRMRRQPPVGSPEESDPSTWRTGTFAAGEAFHGVPHVSIPGTGEGEFTPSGLGTWAIEAAARLDGALVEDLILICQYNMASGGDT